MISLLRNSSRGGVIFLVMVTCCAAQDPIVAIKAGTLVDPSTGTALHGQTILVQGAVIKGVGANVTIPPKAKVIDLGRQTVLPGLIDSHTHLCLRVPMMRSPHAPAFPPAYSGSAGSNTIVGSAGDFSKAFFLATVLDTTGFRAIQGVASARSMLDAGFTTVRDVGNAGNYADTDLRLAIEQGLVPGPTFINSGKIIAPSGGQFPTLLNHEKLGLGEAEYLYADTPDEIKKAVRDNIMYGAKLIKVVVDDMPYVYSVRDLKLVIQEAHEAGMKVAAHCWTRQGAQNAAEAGVDSIEHGIAMDDKALQTAKQNGVTLDVTPFSKDIAEEYGAPEWHTQFVDVLRRAYQMGVHMTFGSDMDFDLPGRPRGQIAAAAVDNYIEAGIPAKVILQIWIPNGAHLLGVDNTRGSIRPGMAADVIATTENPLENINTLKHVVFVMKNGSVVREH